MNNKLIPIVLTLVVGIILAGSVLVPVLNDAQKDLGDPITKTNPVYNSWYRDIEPTDVWEMSSTGYVLNDETMDTGYRQAVFGDSFVLYLNALNLDNIGYVIGKNDENPTQLVNTKSYTITFDNNTISIVDGDNTAVYSKEYTWAYTLCPSEDTAKWGTITRIGDGDTTYILNNNQVVLSGYYYTGDNDTFYSYKDGTLYIGSYEGGMEITKTLVDGTTDIYKIDTEVVTVGDETFTPYITLVPISVTGHATAGASYSLLGAIPIMVIVALIMGAVGMIVAKRND